MNCLNSLALTATLFVALPARGDNWPRFRGPDGSAIGPEISLPDAIEPKHVAWKTPIGAGDSSPCIWDDKLFLTASTPDGKTRTLVCFDAGSGKEVWQTPLSFGTHKKHKKNSYATATPATDGERVYCLFSDENNFKAYAFDFAGKQVWEANLGAYASQHGSGASPILHGPLLIVPNEQDGASSIVALDKTDGKVRWKADRPTQRTSFSTPVGAMIDGTAYIVVLSTAGLTGLDPTLGKEVWTCTAFDRRTVASPFVAGGLVFGSSGEGSRGDKLVAVSPSGSQTTNGAGANKLAPVWTETKLLPYCTTPVAVGEHLYMVSDSPAVARCVETKTGVAKWQTERLPGKFSASPVCAGKRLFALAEEGDLFVFAVDPTAFRQLGKSHLDDTFVSTPAIAHDGLYIRGEKYLWRLAAAAPKGARP